MKRLLSFILLLFVLTVSVHPIITLHFCKGDLHSFTVIANNEVNACCVLSTLPENNSLEIYSIDQFESNDHFVETCESCCSFQKVEIITDNFTLEHTNMTIQKPIAFSYIPMAALIDYLINLFTPDAIIKSNNHTSPTGWYNTTLKFLSYICVYRL